MRTNKVANFNIQTVASDIQSMIRSVGQVSATGSGAVTTSGKFQSIESRKPVKKKRIEGYGMEPYAEVR